ncbi:MAG TPA: ATP-binding protein [Nodosilinea sp.]|nr:ATP-binding protein [Nodosilinea sp.]
MSVGKDEFLTPYIDKVQSHIQTLYRDAQQFPVNHSLQLVITLEELRLAIEELHVAEEELLAQNEQLIATQQALEVESQRYQDLFELAPDGYVVTDVNGVVQEANYAAAALFNREKKYLIGKPLVTHVPPSERLAFRSLLNQIASSQRVQGWELTLQRVKADDIVVAMTVETVKNAADKAVAVRWQMRDISDRKKAEAALSQLQAQNLELLEADRLRTQLLATVSHELKTPLHAVLGFSQILMKQLPCQQDATTSKMAERIFHNGQHLLKLIESMLSFSQLRVQQVELQLETFDLAELVTTTLDELSSLADQKALLLETELPDGPFLVVNDRDRLRQIITNLVSNAIKFTNAGRVVVIVRALPPDRLLLAVRDTGCGISAADQAKIFHEFWQVHDIRNKKDRGTSGTGLGLAIVQALVKVMQGTITVESELGRGSQFRVELPQTVTPHPTNSSTLPLI